MESRSAGLSGPDAVDRIVIPPVEIFVVNHADFSVEPLNGVSKGGEHPLCDILVSAGVNTPAAKWASFINSSLAQCFGSILLP